MKRTLLLLMTVVLILSFCGCSEEQTYAEQRFIDSPSQLIPYDLISTENQIQIKNAYLTYLKSALPKNQGIQRLTVNDVMLMETVAQDINESYLFLIDWYGNVHIDRKDTIKINDETVEVTGEFKEMLFFYKNGEVKTFDQALAQGEFSEEQLSDLPDRLKDAFSDWKYPRNYQDGAVSVHLTPEATEGYTDLSAKTLSEMLGAEILSVEYAAKLNDYDDITHKPTEKIFLSLTLSVPQRGARELYSLLHMLDKHTDVKSVSLVALDRIAPIW